MATVVVAGVEGIPEAGEATGRTTTGDRAWKACQSLPGAWAPFARALRYADICYCAAPAVAAPQRCTMPINLVYKPPMLHAKLPAQLSARSC